MGTRTTVRLDETLMKKVKHYAVEHNKTLAKVIEEALRDKLETNTKTSYEPFLPVVSLGGPKPGVDLSNSSLLQDIMDGLVDPS